MSTDQPNSANSLDEEEIRLAPPDGMSEAQRITRSRIYSPFKDPDRHSRGRFQFTLASLAVVAFFVCFGLAGSSWMPASVFAGFVGVLTLLILAWTSSESRAADIPLSAWIGIIIAYLAAILVALIRVAA